MRIVTMKKRKKKRMKMRIMRLTKT